MRFYLPKKAFKKKKEKKKEKKKRSTLFSLSFFLKLMGACGGNKSYRIDTRYNIFP